MKSLSASDSYCPDTPSMRLPPSSLYVNTSTRASLSEDSHFARAALSMDWEGVPAGTVPGPPGMIVPVTKCADASWTASQAACGLDPAATSVHPSDATHHSRAVRVLEFGLGGRGTARVIAIFAGSLGGPRKRNHGGGGETAG